MHFALRPLLTLACLAVLSGCGAAATPCRIASAGLDVIPVIGGVLSAPTDGCAAAID